MKFNPREITASVTWVIPARKGSKRIENKNLQELDGESLIRRAAETFSSLRDRVIVATDCEKIAEEVKDLDNVYVFMRSYETATDVASSESVVDEVLKHCNLDTDYIGLAQCTTPFVDHFDLVLAHAKMRSGYDNVVSAYRTSQFVWSSDGEAFFDKKKRKRTQDHYVMIENGAFYCFKREKYTGSRFVEGDVAFAVMPENRSLEIDYPIDLKEAREKIQ